MRDGAAGPEEKGGRLKAGLAGRAQSFGYALEGLAHLIRTQPNAQIHAAATAAVIVLGLLLRVGWTDAAILALTIALVWFAEAMNTAFEHLCDVVRPEVHPSVKRCKDIAAAAVLLASVGAVFVALFVFVPRLVAAFGG